MKLLSTYRSLIGILTFIILLTISGWFAYFTTKLHLVKTTKIIACVLSSLVIFFGLHYITLTSFGFTDSERRLSFIPAFVNAVPFLTLSLLLATTAITYVHGVRKEAALTPLNYEERLEVMMSSGRSLKDKLNSLKLELKDPRIENQMKISFDEQIFKNRIKEGFQLSDFYEPFSISENLRQNLSQKFISTDKGKTLVTLANDRTIELSKTRTTVLGFFQERDVFVTSNKDESGRIQIESISRIDGTTLDGIPLISNNSSRLYADVNFRYSVNSADLRIAVWQRMSDRTYRIRQHQVIPLGIYHTATNRSIVKNIRWQSDSLLLDLIFKEENVLKEMNFTIY